MLGVTRFAVPDVARHELREFLPNPLVIPCFAAVDREGFGQLRGHQHQMHARPRDDVLLQKIDKGVALRRLVVATGHYQHDKTKRAQQEVHRRIQVRAVPLAPLYNYGQRQL